MPKRQKSARKAAVNDRTASVRTRLRVWAKLNHGATAADAAQALGVTRQRIRQIAEQEQIEFPRHHTEPPPGQQVLIHHDGLRTPVGVAALRKDTCVVVCQDGSLFMWDATLDAWEEVRPIPGSSRASQLLDT